MRVIAGLYKRRILVSPKGTEIRPTSDRIKENLFNILSAEIRNTHVLDLFAGTGSLGIEALSRGAKHVVFVESNKLALASIEQNLLNLQIRRSDFLIIPKNVNDFLTSSKKIKDTFDIIFADPPYAHIWEAKDWQIIENSGYCSKNCLFVLEKSAKNKFQNHESALVSQKWTLKDSRQYGKTQLEFWRRND